MIPGKVGTQLPGRHLPFRNRGVGREKVANLAARWSNDTLILRPEVARIRSSSCLGCWSHAPSLTRRRVEHQ